MTGEFLPRREKVCGSVPWDSAGQVRVSALLRGASGAERGHDRFSFSGAPFLVPDGIQAGSTVLRRLGCTSSACVSAGQRVEPFRNLAIQPHDPTQIHTTVTRRGERRDWA
jgi:hypothetical protein